MEFFERERAVMDRARDVLGVEAGVDNARLRYAYHCRMIEHHPDTSSDPDAERLAALINEAFQLLTGRERKAQLLLDETLARRVASRPLDDIAAAPSYEEWLKNQFLNMETKSIWAY